MRIDPKCRDQKYIFAFNDLSYKLNLLSLVDKKHILMALEESVCHLYGINYQVSDFEDLAKIIISP